MSDTRTVDEGQGIQNLRKAYRERGQALKKQGQRIADLEAQLGAQRDKLARFEATEVARIEGAAEKLAFGDDDNLDLFKEEVPRPTEDEVVELPTGNELRRLLGEPDELDANSQAARQVTSIMPGPNPTESSAGELTMTGRSVEEMIKIMEGTPDTPEGYRALQALGLFPKDTRK